MGAGFNVVARGAAEADIYIYEDIGGWFGGVTSKQFGDELRALGTGVKTINVRINSAGGEVFEGVAIYNLLAQHPATVIAHIDGQAASIASIIAMAGDTIRVAESAFVMIHNPAGGVMGGSDDMRRMADTLDTIRGSMVDIYVERTKQPRAQIEAWMTAETWMTGDQALTNGFADEMVTNLRVAARVDAVKHGFRNTPAALIAAAAAEIAPVGEQQLSPASVAPAPRLEAARNRLALMRNAAERHTLLRA